MPLSIRLENSEAKLCHKINSSNSSTYSIAQRSYDINTNQKPKKKKTKKTKQNETKK